MRLSRRAVLRLGALGLASAGAVRLALDGAAPLRADDEAPRLRSERIDARPEATEPSGALRSAVHRAPYEVNAVGALWTGELGDVAVRTSRDGFDWSPWRRLGRAEDHAGPGEQPAMPRCADLQFAPGTRYVQVRWRPDPERPAARPALEVIDSVDGPGPREILRRQDLGYRSVSGRPPPVPVISRAAWGADERLTRDATGKPIWPAEYRVVQKCIVHHTGTELPDDNYPAALRAIYRYHAVTRGWGDIGYNFIVDPRGNVYEGRAGGPNVVGGHALQYNWGSVGIALLGDYDALPLGAAVRSALTRLVAWKCQFLNPHDWSYFADRELPNLFGHCDCLTTECPGDNFYAWLPELRDGVIALLGNVPRPAARVTAATFTPDRPFVGGVVKIEVTVENIGSATLSTAGPRPGFQYLDAESFAVHKLPSRRGALRVGVDMAGNALGTPYPYRWGLDDALEPGQTAKVTGYLRATTPREAQIWAALLLGDEPVGDGRLGLRTLQVRPAHRVFLPFTANNAR